MNSRLQNQKLRIRALSSKAASLLGKFPDREPVTNCARNNKNGPPGTRTCGSHQEEETPASFLVPIVTALHEQTLDVKPGE
jgi:hypothetical protein